MTLDDTECVIRWTPGNEYADNVGQNFEVTFSIKDKPPGVHQGSREKHHTFFVEVLASDGDPPDNPPAPDDPPAEPEVLGVIVGDEKETFFVGETITGTFTIKNSGTTSVILDELVLGGRLNGVNDCSNYVGGECPDFAKVPNITLAPGASYTYSEIFVPQLPGTYDFQPFYRIGSEWTWNISPSVFAEVQGMSLRWPLVGVGSPTNRSISGYRFGDHWLNRYCITPGLTTKKLLHTGVDYGAANGTDVVAAHGGTVRFAATDPDEGGYVIVESYGGGYTTIYTHVTPSVTVGTNVDEGDKIGDVVLKSHLHFQIRVTSYFLRWSLRGRLPEVLCDAGQGEERVFPENFINPEIINWR